MRGMGGARLMLKEGLFEKFLALKFVEFIILQMVDIMKFLFVKAETMAGLLFLI